MDSGGRAAVEQQCGEGGYGSVYKGELPNQTLVAVKVLKNLIDDIGEDFTNEVRPCAERLLIVLAQHSKQKRVGRAIWRKFIESASYDVHDLTQVVRRDAVYTALGRLRDYLPATQTEGYDEEHEKIQNDRIDVSQAFVEHPTDQG